MISESPPLPERLSTRTTPACSETTHTSTAEHAHGECEEAVGRQNASEIRAEIRAGMRQELFDITGILDPIGMRWTNKLFLKNIVGKYNCGLFGWPPDIPFQCLSRLTIEPLRELLRVWKTGELRIARLTDEQRTQAAVDPTSFLPNTTLRPPSPPRPSEDALRVVPLVLHPVDMHDLSQRPATVPSVPPFTVLTTTALSKKRKRKQRCDTKRARKRDLRYGLGVKSPEYVYEPAVRNADEADEAEPVAMALCEALSDDYIEEFPDVAAEVESDIEQFTEPEPEQHDEIESASESWMLGERSEVDEVVDDEDEE